MVRKLACMTAISLRVLVRATASADSIRESSYGSLVPAVTIDLMQTPRLHYLGHCDQQEGHHKSNRCGPNVEGVHAPPDAKVSTPLSVQ